jgi:large subunit ribosomal protein L13
VKTYSAKPEDIEKKWLVIDAKDIVLGRLASEVSRLLRGKHKAGYTPHMDCGDNIIITNAEQVYLSGNKRDINKGKNYKYHTGYPGGLKTVTAGKLLESKNPERVIRYAVKRMLPRNKLRDQLLSNLYVYKGGEHPHEAQKPEHYDFASKNTKNSKA